MKIGEAISKRLLDICDKKNISVNKLAKKINLSETTIGDIVNCESTNPKLLTLVKICDGLDISMSEFFNDDIFLNIEDDKKNIY